MNVETANKVYSTYSPGPVYVPAPGQENSYPPSGTYHVAAPKRAQQAYTSQAELPISNVVPTTPVRNQSDATTEIVPTPSYEENSTIGSGSRELVNIFGPSYHWTWEQVAEWIEKLFIDGHKLHTLNFQTIESELLIDDATVQAKLIRDIQGLRTSLSDVVITTPATNTAVNDDDNTNLAHGEGSRYPPSGTYQVATPQPTSLVVPANPNVVANTPETKTPPKSQLFQSTPRHEETETAGCASYELENMFGASYHWSSEQVSEWVQSRG
ncbi:hypothetical protein HDU76_003030, partial [Blyttiomyces sp. JEL0837]